MRDTRIRATLVAGLATVACGALGTLADRAAAAPSYPVVDNGIVGYGAHALTPRLPAAGSHFVDSDDSTPAAACHSASHPEPVVLVDGTGANQADDFAAVSPLLADNGYCVYSDNVGGPSRDSPIQAIGDIPTSAAQLSTIVDKVRAATGASKVALVGHSQGGGVLPRWYLKYDGGASKVDTLVGLAPSNHGTTLSGLQTLAKQYGVLGVFNGGFDLVGAPAAVQQEDGSALNRQLDAGGDTVAGVAYTNIVSRYDEVVTPYQHQYLTAGPGATVHNILLQDVCSADHGEHLSVVYDHVAGREMLNALDPAHPVAPVCSYVAPVAGG